MADRRIVLDASVVVKWFHDETQTNEALRILNEINDGRLAASVPDLLLYEVANVLVRGVGKSSTQITDALRILAEMSWEVVTPSATLLEDASSLAVHRPPLTVYDAVYVALALRRNVELVTADVQLHRLVGSPVTRLL